MKALDIDDGKYFSLGSLNQDHSSYYMNNEANLFFAQYMVKKSEKESIQHSREYRQFIKIYNNLK